MKVQVRSLNLKSLGVNVISDKKMERERENERGDRGIEPVT